MKIVHFKGAETGSPDSAEWHAWRAQGIGGSDAAVLAYNAELLPAKEAQGWQKDYAGLLAEKRGEAGEDKAGNNFAAKRGKALESMVAEMVNEATGIPFFAAFGEMDAHPFVRSSFDGVTFDLECINEIKVASKKVHEAALAGEVISYYRPQLVHQALTAWGPPEGWGNDRAQFFANYNDNFDQPLALIEIPSNTEWLKRYAEALLPLHVAFWDEVKKGRGLPPEVEEQIALVARLKAQIVEIEAKLDPAKESLVAYVEGLGVPKFEHNGLTLFKSSRQGSVDYAKALKALEIDPEKLEPFRKAGTTSWTLKVA